MTECCVASERNLMHSHHKMTFSSFPTNVEKKKPEWQREKNHYPKWKACLPGRLNWEVFHFSPSPKKMILTIFCTRHNHAIGKTTTPNSGEKYVRTNLFLYFFRERERVDATTHVCVLRCCETVCSDRSCLSDMIGGKKSMRTAWRYIEWERNQQRPY